MKKLSLKMMILKMALKQLLNIVNTKSRKTVNWKLKMLKRMKRVILKTQGTLITLVNIARAKICTKVWL